MGTWSHRSFDNDGALDWLNELDIRGLGALRGALRTVAATTYEDYLDIDDAQWAIAAAEVVAASRGRSCERMPVLADIWLDANAAKITARDVTLARKAIARIRAGNSELDNAGAEWRAEIEALVGRLSAPPIKRPRSNRKRPKPPEPSRRKEVASPDRSLWASATEDRERCVVHLRYKLAELAR